MKKVLHSKPESVRAQDQKRKDKQTRKDGWTNVVTLLGTSADKRTASKLEWQPYDSEFFEQLYAGGGIPARIVDLVPEHSMREWVSWEDVDEEEEALIEERCQELNLRSVFCNAWKWGRAYGGGLLYIVTDTSDPSSPLQYGETVLSLQDLSRWDVRIMTTDVEYDMGSPNFGKPRIYYLNVQMGSQFKGYPVHWTRMVRMDGQLVPRRTYIRNNYWHDSVLNRVYNSIRNYETANDSVAACLLDFNVDVFKMKNLANLISSGNEAVVKNRIETMSYVKSVLNSMIIDADSEDYENKSRSLEGVAELLRIQADRLVADTDIPHTILLGESPDGSSATGNSTSQQWYNFISTEQENYAAPKLRRLLKIIFPDQDIDFKFNSLRVMDDAEKAELHLKQAQADAIYLEKNVLDPSEVAQSRFGGQDYSIETQLDVEGRENGTIIPGEQDFPEEEDGNSEGSDEPGDKGLDDGGDEPPAGKKPKPSKKNDDVFHIAGDQPPEGKSRIAAKPSEPEPAGDFRGEEPDKTLEGNPSDQAEGNGVEGLFLSRKNPGTEFDLRNEQGSDAGTDPKVTSFIGQTMSEPFRDPRTNPQMKGPGIPNAPRTVLPTRGTGIVAQSGYDMKKDPKLAAAAREQGGVEGHSIESKADADQKTVKNKGSISIAGTRDSGNFKEGDHPRAEGGKFGSGGGKSKAPAKGSKPKPAKKEKAEPKPKEKAPAKKEPKEHGHSEKGGEGSSALEYITKAAEAGAKASEDSVLDSGVAATMKEFAKGSLKSSSGKKVTNPKQAAAIGYSEERGDERSRAATIIVRDGDKFLMGPTNKDGRWTMPGGKIEDGESAHQGALRELAEETGINAGKMKFLGTRLVESQKGKNTEVHMYEHHIKDGVKPTHKLDPDKEISGWKWLNSKEPLPPEVSGNLKHANNVALDHMKLLK